MKWELIKKKRIELQKHFQEVSDKFNFAGTWIHIVLKHVVAKRFHDNCRNRIVGQIKMIKFVFMINMAKFRFRRWITHLRPTLLGRNQQQIKQSLSMIANLKLVLQKDQAALIFKEFMYRTYFINGMTAKVRKTYTAIVLIQKSFREHSLSMHTRVNSLSDGAWPHYLAITIHYFIRLRGPNRTQKAEELAFKLNVINPEIKKRVIALYLSRRCLQHTIRFLLWMLLRRKKRYDEKKVSYYLLNFLVARIA